MTNPKNNIVLDVDAFKKIVGKFAKEAPELLTSHPNTFQLGLELERLRLQEALDHQFTVAVVGRMKSGKSMLLNTLLDTNALAVGIEETTATVNWLWHGTGDRCKNFRVHWRDGRTELKPLEEVGAWTGEGLNISKTKYLEFFVESPFLKIANFVDTPGTETHKPDHERATRDFISAKLEEETLKHGGFASAILYVFGAAVPKESNAELLNLCGINTRLPGSLPTNSIAVVQKWDQIGEADEDPLVIVENHCERLKQQLDSEISEVLATCPPLEIAAKHVSDLDIWNELAKCGAGAKSEKIGCLLSNADSFSSVRERMREAISKVFPIFPYWPVIRFSIRVAHARRIDDGNTLRGIVKKASGIDELKRILKTRFLDRSYLLHASTILAKVAAPCETAQGILLEIIRNRPNRLQSAMKILMASPYKEEVKLIPVQDLLQKEINSIDDETQRAKDLMEKLIPIQEQAESSRKDFDADISSLRALAEADVSAWLNDDDMKLDEDDIAFLQRLFGKDGKSVRQRLGLNDECELSLDQVNELYYEWFDRVEEAEDSGHKTLPEICEHAAERLHDIATYIEDLHT